jgi:hypothetical protein
MSRGFRVLRKHLLVLLDWSPWRPNRRPPKAARKLLHDVFQLGPSRARHMHLLRRRGRRPSHAGRRGWGGHPRERVGGRRDRARFAVRESACADEGWPARARASARACPKGHGGRNEVGIGVLGIGAAPA